MAQSTRNSPQNGTQDGTLGGPQAIRPDICVIGAGAGGLAAAAAAAAFGSRCRAHRERPHGRRDALWRLAAGAGADRGRRAGAGGAHCSAVRRQDRALRRRFRRRVSARARGRRRGGAARFARALCRPRRARHRRRRPFHRPRHRRRSDGLAIKARRFIIATGSSPELPPIPGLADVPHLTSETVFDLDDCPRHLIVHRRRPGRARNGAGVPPARRRGHRARSGRRRLPATIANAPPRARRARPRRRRAAQRRENRAGAARPGARAGRYFR